MSGASKQMSAAERAREASSAERSKRMSERCEGTSERTSEWPITNVPISRGSESLCSGRNDMELTLTHLLAPHCSLILRALLRSLICTLAHGKEVYMITI